MTTNQTLALIKPLSVIRGHSSLIRNAIVAASAMTDTPLRCSPVNALLLTPDVVAEFYHEHKDRAYYPDLLATMTVGVCHWTIVFNPDNKPVVAALRKLQSEVIRPIFSMSGRCDHLAADNALHASDSVENAEREIAILKRFRPRSMGKS